VSGENSISSTVASLTGGSGIDIRKLAEDLTDVERKPAEERLTNLRDQESAQISAYAVLKFNVEELITRFEALDDASEVLASKASSSDTTKVEISNALGSASSGNHAVSVSSLAQQQSNVSNLYSSASQSLNGGAGFTLSITDSLGAATTVAVSDGSDTPEGVVAAINASNADVSASLLTTDADSSQFRIVMNGNPGASNTFGVSSKLTDSDLGFHDVSNGNSQQADGIYAQQLATNAVFSVNGVSLERTSNTVTDAVEGVTLVLKGTHGTGSSATVTIEKSIETLKSSLSDLVQSYNATRYALSEIADPDSADQDVGGALASDFATIRHVRSVIYKAVTQDSSTASGSISALRDIGVELTKAGDLQFDEKKFDAALSTSANDVALMLSAGSDNQSKYDGQPQGLARDAMASLDTLNDSVDGLFATRTESSRRQLFAYEQDLEDLDTKMSALYDRYVSQFTIMEALVSQLNSTRTSLTETWANMGNFDR
tara:strand:- start:1406 stop:2872 length:1467 start_codon:yes stop_codon:yes gene_type:complete